MNEQTMSIEFVPSRTKVEQLKTEIEQKETIPLDEQTLIHEGVVLKEGFLLSKYNIQEGSKLRLVRKIKGSKIVYFIVLYYEISDIWDMLVMFEDIFQLSVNKLLQNVIDFGIFRKKSYYMSYKHHKITK